MAREKKVKVEEVAVEAEPDAKLATIVDMLEALANQTGVQALRDQVKVVREALKG